MEGKSSQIICQCLSISLVLKKIFEYISTADLLFSLSLVNKLWNYEARSVVRDRGNVIAHLNFQSSCQDLVATFMKHVENMSVVPFNGISIMIWDHESNCKSWSSRAVLDPCNDGILYQLDFKYLSIRSHKPLEKFINCPAVLLAKRILELATADITLDLAPEQRGSFLAALQNCTFPGIKKLKLMNNRMDHDCWGREFDFVKKLVAHVPKLQQFHYDGDLRILENLIMGESSAVLLVAGKAFNPVYDQLAESMVGILRLKNLHVEKFHPDFNVKKYDRMISGLVRNSCTTLKSMTINSVFAVPLMCSGLCFENVQTFKILLSYYSLESIQPRILSILNGFDFTRMFPNLKKVNVEEDTYNLVPDQIIEAVKYGDALMKTPLPDRAVKIKHLSLFLSLKDETVVAYFAGMFPDIDTLIVNDLDGSIPFGLIWEHWTGLKEFEAHDNISKNLDSVFCGIFPEEVAGLQEKDDEYLRKVHIVPVLPSITCFRGLRALRVLNAEQIFYYPQVTEWPQMFTKVSRFVAFERCPDLPSSLVADLLEHKALITDTSTPLIMRVF